MCQWLQKHSPDRYEKRCDRMTGMFTNFYESFSRDDCGYFNPDIKNGGPNPDETMRGMRIPKNPKSRRVLRERQNRSRREDESSFDSAEYYADIEYESEEMTNEDLEYLDGCDGTETGALAEFCKDDGSIMKVSCIKLQYFCNRNFRLQPFSTTKAIFFKKTILVSCSKRKQEIEKSACNHNQMVQAIHF